MSKIQSYQCQCNLREHKLYLLLYLFKIKALKVSATAAHGSAVSRILPHNRFRSLAPARA